MLETARYHYLNYLAYVSDALVALIVFKSIIKYFSFLSVSYRLKCGRGEVAVTRDESREFFLYCTH